jgi:hypothetical protein
VADAIAVWRPDLVLREPAELGSLAAAVAAGTPLARFSIGVQEMDRYVTALVDEPLTELGELAGLAGSSLADAAAEETCLSPDPPMNCLMLVSLGSDGCCGDAGALVRRITVLPGCST